VLHTCCDKLNNDYLLGCLVWYPACRILIWLFCTVSFFYPDVLPTTGIHQTLVRFIRQ
jgi:hypothetical protein